MAFSRSIVLTLARKFLFSKSSDGFLSFIAWVSVLGVALGVLALTVVTSVINGFEGELSKVITGMNGEVILYTRGEPIQQPELIEKDIQRVLSQAEAITSSFVTELMVSGPDGVAGAILDGFDENTIGKVTEIPNSIVDGVFPSSENEIALGSALAERLGAEVGNAVRLIAPFTGNLNAPPKATEVKVVGIVKMGMYEYDSKFVFMPLENVQAFLNQPHHVTTFNIKLKPGSDSREASDRLSNSFGYPLRSKDWSQLNKNLFYAIKLEKAVIAIILTVIIVVAAFNVVSTLMMMIHDKTREIAILKAIGLRPFQSFQLFCMIGLGIGAVGTLAGVLVGSGVALLLQKTEWITLPSDIYYINFLPVVLQWREIGLISIMAIFISFLATLYPSWKVSKSSPLDGLRYE